MYISFSEGLRKAKQRFNSGRIKCTDSTWSLQVKYNLEKRMLACKIFFIYTNSSPNTLKVFKCIRRICGKYFSTNGDSSKKILSFSPHTPKGIKLSLFRHIFDQFWNKFRSLIIFMDNEWAKKPSNATVPLTTSNICNTNTVDWPWFFTWRNRDLHK